MWVLSLSGYPDYALSLCLSWTACSNLLNLVDLHAWSSAICMSTLTSGITFGRSSHPHLRLRLVTVIASVIYCSTANLQIQAEGWFTHVSGTGAG